MYDKFPDILETNKALYVPCDHFLLAGHTLFSIAEQFYQHGGVFLCLDEIHTYPAWSKELKSIYDSFPDISMLVSGSSSLEIEKGTHDISRRALKYTLVGLSLREYIELQTGIPCRVLTLASLFKSHEKEALSLTKQLSRGGYKVLDIFNNYLFSGYYPYFLEYSEKEHYMQVIEQGMHTSIESDLLSVHPEITGNSLRKIKKLLSFLSQNVPYVPDFSKLKQAMDIGDERTLKTYLKYLEDAGLITSISRAKGGLSELLRPEKIYLNNTNQMYAFSPGVSPNRGTIRETFAVSMMKNAGIPFSVPPRGDLFLDGTYTVEIGGKGKSFDQIKNVQSSFVLSDDLECGFQNRIPLWMLGFLY